PDHDINYPWKTELSAKKIADIKDITTEEVIRQTTKNAREVFEIR
ncbi:MAG: TatD family hydrolase, partial [Candidatus Aenigmarchaeota archaeon]|nr:TatD family hydrolase [Candidatus Aenigmarchaeota archaeon]